MDTCSLPKMKRIRWPCCHNLTTNCGGNTSKDHISKGFKLMADGGTTYQHTTNSKQMNNISNTKNWRHVSACRVGSISIDEVKQKTTEVIKHKRLLSLQEEGNCKDTSVGGIYIFSQQGWQMCNASMSGKESIDNLGWNVKEMSTKVQVVVKGKLTSRRVARSWWAEGQCTAWGSISMQFTKRRINSSYQHEKILAAWKSLSKTKKKQST